MGVQALELCDGGSSLSWPAALLWVLNWRTVDPMRCHNLLLPLLASGTSIGVHLPAAAAAWLAQQQQRPGWPGSGQQ